MPRAAQTAVLSALHALHQRSLVERVQNGFTLQNVVLEYFTAALIEQACAEIRNGSAVLLQRYALLKATAKSYVRESQRSLILGPIAQRAVQEVGRVALMDQLDANLVHLRNTQPRQGGYAGGTILNLLVQLGADLRGQDLSQLAVWQADLRNVDAQDVNFSHTDLAQSAFTETLGEVFCVAISPDGQRLAAATIGNEIHMWRVSDGKPLLTWIAHRGWVKSVCFSPDGSTLASGGGDRMVRLWNVQDGRQLAILQGHTNDVISVCFRPDGNVVASASYDHTARLWDINTRRCLRILYGHTDWLWSVCFSPDGSILATASFDHTVRL
jgi:hypothetical protein